MSRNSHGPACPALISTLCLVLAWPTSAVAGTQGAPERHAGPAVAVTARQPGLIARTVEREAVRLAREAHAAQALQPQPQAKSSGSWISRHPVAFGALVGTGAGLGVGIYSGSRPCVPGKGSGCSTQPVAYLLGPIFGALIGTGVGLVVALVR
jgi:hypothetical protein